MKNLKDILVEKLDINKVNLSDIDFPVDGSFDDILAFLVKNKYIKFTANRNLFSAFNIASKKAFVSEYYKDTDWNIWFGNTSKGLLSEDNPLFLIQNEPKSGRNFYYSPDNLTTPRTKKDFMKALKKYLKL